jgi:general secretion pathway protein D
LTYYLTFFDLNLDTIIRLAATSRDARILSTPVVLTTDNTEAKINIGEERPVVTSTSTTDTGTQTQNFQYRSIGIDLAVTPRINPQRYVVMEIAQKADNVGGFEVINGNRVPIITKREINAQIAVQSRNTIVLGGLVSTDKTRSRTKIPLLGDIPLLGALFRADSREEARTELLVLITPYVLLTPEEARQETVRLHSNSQASKTRWPTGWSDSELPRLTPDQTDQILRARQAVETPGLIRDLFSGSRDDERGATIRRVVDLTPELDEEAPAEPAGDMPMESDEETPVEPEPESWASSEPVPAPAAPTPASQPVPRG